MFINPEIAIREGWITHPACQSIDDWKSHKYISPNAIDFTVDKMFTINDDLVRVSENVKMMASGRAIVPEYDSRYKERFFCIGNRCVVDGMSDIFVKVPKGVACLPMVVRSTFNRNGVFITSGLYDSGYEGHIGFAIHNQRNAPSFIGVGTRVGQIVFVESDSAGLYAGGWNHKEGTHYSEKE